MRTPLRPSLRDIVNRTARSRVPGVPVVWTWCHACGQWFELGSYILHLQGLAEYERRAA